MNLADSPLALSAVLCAVDSVLPTKDAGHSTIEINGFKLDVPGPWWVGLIVVLLSIYSFIWVSEDAQRRGKSGCLAFLFVLVAGWPLSLLWWLWLRPEQEKPSAQPPPPLPPANP